MDTYLKIFNFLWRIKRVEYSLSYIWRRHMNSVHDSISIKKFSKQFHQYYIVRNEMLHFIKNFQYYIMFEVLESSWQDLLKDIKNAPNLDFLITSHSKYLLNIMNKSLLSSDILLKDLTDILTIIIQFCNIQDNLFIILLEKDIIQNVNLKKFQNQENNFKSETLLIDNFQNQLIKISKEYNEKLEIFIHKLAENNDENLQFFTFRLDFNEYYENRQKKKVSNLTDSFISSDNEDG